MAKRITSETKSIRAAIRDINRASVKETEMNTKKSKATATNTTNTAVKENIMDAIKNKNNIGKIKLIPNERKNGMELHFKGFVTQEEFAKLLDMGWKWGGKKLGYYFARFNSLLWDETHEYVTSKDFVILDEKPEPIRDYTRKPTIVEKADKTIELRGVRRIDDEELDLELQGLGWNWDKRGQYYKAGYSKRRIAKTEKLLGLEPKAAEPNAQIAMPLPQMAVAVGETAVDFYSIFGK